jgi:acyl-homoserine lactone acylase PvdQ
VPVLLAPIVVSGANIYTAWTNATTLGNDDPVFFTKSNDGGNTFANTTVISTANKNPNTVVINQNISIGSSGNNVAVSWWTNRTGIFNPVIRISNDGGNTFANIIRLNSTSGGTNK